MTNKITRVDDWLAIGTTAAILDEAHLTDWRGGVQASGAMVLGFGQIIILGIILAVRIWWGQGWWYVKSNGRRGRAGINDLGSGSSSLAGGWTGVPSSQPHRKFGQIQTQDECNYNGQSNLEKNMMLSIHSKNGQIMFANISPM